MVRGIWSHGEVKWCRWCNNSWWLISSRLFVPWFFTIFLQSGLLELPSLFQRVFPMGSTLESVVRGIWSHGEAKWCRWCNDSWWLISSRLSVTWFFGIFLQYELVELLSLFQRVFPMGWSLETVVCGIWSHGEAKWCGWCNNSWWSSKKRDSWLVFELGVN